MGFFAKLLNNINQHGIPGLETAPYYIIIAEKKGFPPRRETIHRSCNGKYVAHGKTSWTMISASYSYKYDEQK